MRLTTGHSTTHHPCHFSRAIIYPATCKKNCGVAAQNIFNSAPCFALIEEKLRAGIHKLQEASLQAVNHLWGIGFALGHTTSPRQAVDINPDPATEARVHRQTAFVELSDEKGVRGTAEGGLLRCSTWEVVRSSNWQIPERCEAFPPHIQRPYQSSSIFNKRSVDVFNEHPRRCSSCRFST